ncbi:MAG: T9SS type A sorting domain-containing protein [Bacteroidetes bacterium]|nr:T9SS type A sorting domain-containing protein [Bacteroidota bacterium]MBU1580235.1 T9SS type A sorting domain-containing protein [Bacteroidota bacterium]MBU2466854.1 T9SS type A sorting domain-containing protein [Bacteroidota bacterium]MBU2556373.1 T9SS type A sorting domain-containing protein [Bacteroidota bacterium]
MRNRLLFLFLSFSVTAFSQITINSSDMPVAGDTLRSSIAYNMDSFDFSATGENYTWDFSALIPIEQRVDTFITVTETPVSFWPFFLTSANLVTKFNPAGLLPGLPSAEAFRFFQNSTASYKDVGYGLILEGTPIPLKYAQADEIYRFPMTYGQSYNAASGLEIGLPGMGYLMIDRERQNEVDGWGSLTTPFGTFEVIRYRSTVDEYDSLFLEETGMGQALQRNYIEYHWVAKEMGIPLLQVLIDESLGSTAVYRDSARFITVGVSQQLASAAQLQVYPNPVEQFFTLKLSGAKAGNAFLQIFDMQGRQTYAEAIAVRPGVNEIKLSTDETRLKAGIYYIRILSDKLSLQTKIMVVK